MTAGAMPMPLNPDADASPGAAVASSASGTISRPNSAIDGTVWMTLSTAKTGACAIVRGETSAMPSGMPTKQRRQQRGHDDFESAAKSAT